MSSESSFATLLQALDASDGGARLGALQALPSPLPGALQERLEHLLVQDPAPLIRREILRILFDHHPPLWRAATRALSDPVWRVRMQAVRGLRLAGQNDPSLREPIQEECARFHEGNGRVEGALELLREGWGASPRALPRAPESVARGLGCWDEDPAVLLQKIRREGRLERPEALLGLLKIVDARQVHGVWEEIRAEVIERLLKRDGDHDEVVVRALEEPRYPYLVGWVRAFLERLEQPRRVRLAARIRETPSAYPESARRWAEGEPMQERGPSYFPWRGADLRPAQASVAGPAKSTPQRTLGAGGIAVGPLGLSGRYGLSPRAYAHALEAGVNLFFWEPEYAALGQFLSTLPPHRKASLAVLAGSFEATPRAIRRDLEGALRLLQRESIPLFLLFWARSQGRLSEEVVEGLERLKAQGKIGTWGISTHDRKLGSEALERGARVIMLRYNAAHRGAESHLLPEIQRHEAGALAFTSLCYGRLLTSTSPAPPPSASELYQFVLEHPAIGACISAPRHEHELIENLSVLTAPRLTPERVQELRDHGDKIYTQSRRFQDLIRTR